VLVLSVLLVGGIIAAKMAFFRYDDRYVEKQKAVALDCFSGREVLVNGGDGDGVHSRTLGSHPLDVRNLIAEGQLNCKVTLKEDGLVAVEVDAVKGSQLADEYRSHLSDASFSAEVQDGAIVSYGG
jgi:hypothetical protein